jgi:hypothetical protein
MSWVHNRIISYLSSNEAIQCNSVSNPFNKSTKFDQIPRALFHVKQHFSVFAECPLKLTSIHPDKSIPGLSNSTKETQSRSIPRSSLPLCAIVMRSCAIRQLWHRNGQTKNHSQLWSRPAVTSPDRGTRVNRV